MTMNEKQVLFASLVSKLLTYAFRTNNQVIIAEAYRPPETAAAYAKQGKGIKNSLHTKKLAIDLFRFKDGTVSWDTEDYRKLGEYWKSLHPLARWGGDFRRRDAVHFSIEHKGVK